MDFRNLLTEKVVIFDGAMGTSVQRAAPNEDAYEGHDGLNDWLTLSRPDTIREIHASFLEVGCDVIETNTFGAFPVVLDEYGLGAESHRLCLESAKLAREVAAQFDGPRFVAGSMGPGTKLPSLGHISWPGLVDAFEPMAAGLVDGGCDLLLIETCQDLLQTRAALAAVRRVFKATGRELPVGLQITIETTGTMLTGSDVNAALTALLPLGPAFIGLNCATGPDAMRNHALSMCRHSPVPVSVLPNAGLPRNVDGEMVYDLSAADFAERLAEYVTDFGVGIVGGCCGTLPEHLAALVAKVGGAAAPRREAVPLQSLSSLYGAVALSQEPRPLLIGERTNANGSRKFKNLQANEDLDGMVALAVEQQEEGAHILDVCVAYVGRDEAVDMDLFTGRLNTECTLPLMIDSTSPDAIEAALKRLGGRSIVNSVNLEDGEGRARLILSLCAQYGAAVVALCIDEKGMARTPEHKLEVARRLVALAEDYGLSASDMLFDPLTFTLGSGDADYRDSALQTLEGIRLIKAEIPGSRCLLGLSNISFGLKPALRRILNSIFLQRALDAGLDAAILHAGKILAPSDIPADMAAACTRLIDDDQADGDPLEFLLEAEPAPRQDAEELAALSPAERLHDAILRGNASGLGATLDEELEERPALGIINDVLLNAMREVGELFGSGKMQLPFVLKSAAVMKAAVSHLEPHMDKNDSSSRGSIVLATVKGDVHDIGKNLVGIILGNNGFDIHDLGVKVTIEQMIEMINRVKPDAVGMSGLLVKSTIVMKENLEALNVAGLDLPVILGGAALTRSYVEADLRASYEGRVYYAEDAFAGMQLMESISAGDPPPAEVRARPDKRKLAIADAKAPAGPVKPAPARIPEPPFWGSRVDEDLDIRDVWPYLNRAALFKGRWGYTRGRLSGDQYKELLKREVEPELARLKASAEADHWLQPKTVRGYFPVAAEGDNLLVFTDAQRTTPSWTFEFPRQQGAKGLCLSDYFQSRSGDGLDVLSVFAVTVGEAATRYAQSCLDENDYHRYLLVHGLSVESAEALAETTHRQIRRELGIDGIDDPDPAQLIRGRYQGRRYSFGYPACPELDDQLKLAEMLNWGRVGITLTEECLLIPEQSVSALVMHHPDAEYFSIARG